MNGLTILGMCTLILLLSGCLHESPTDDIDWEAEIARYRYCESQLELVNHTIYDLIDDYNLSCKKIDFLIASCKEVTHREVEDYGLFSNTYHDVSYGVCEGKTYIREWTRSENKVVNCSPSSKETTSIYLRQHYIDYYTENC